MIAGNDIIIESAFPKEIADQLLRFTAAKWPNLVLEDANTSEEIAFQIPNLLSLPKEFFIYRDAAAKKTWDEEGACIETTDTMMHVLIASRAVTVVVDNPEAEINRKVIGALQEFSGELLIFRHGVAV